jgi:signal transduction histidine kinase
MNLAAIITLLYLLEVNLLDISTVIFVSTVALVLAFVLASVNQVENLRLQQAVDEDMDLVLANHQPENAKLALIYNRQKEMAQQIQVQGQETSVDQEAIIQGERNRISRELHDSVSQELFAATMILSTVANNPKLNQEQIMAQTNLALGILHNSQDELRALLLHLRPSELNGKSLSQAILGLVDELRAKISSEIKTDVTSVTTSQNVEENLFRIAQELLSNTLRHAKAKHIGLELRQDQDNVYLVVNDDGNGFDTTNEKTASYGLKNMKERAALLGGTVTVQSQPGLGTHVEVRIPSYDR